MSSMMSVEHRGSDPSVQRASAAHEREIPEHEFEISYARGSGPGGQKRNKTETKAILRWGIEASGTFTAAEKMVIQEALASKITRTGYLALENDVTRSKEQNRVAVIAEARRLVSEALIPVKERVATEPSAADARRRVEDKRRTGRVKQERRRREDE